ncbi:hypothetical protein C7S15_5640 [Burkholderia cepacia]|nr:hypothetical protein [Burkholderia cepacia]
MSFQRIVLMICVKKLANPPHHTSTNTYQMCLMVPSESRLLLLP